MWCFHFGLCFIVRVLFIFTKEKLLLFSFSYHCSLFPVILYDELNFFFYLYSVCPLIDRCQQSSLAITGSYLFYWSSYQSIGNHFFLRNFWRGINILFFLGDAWEFAFMVQYTSVILDFLFFFILIICCLLYNWIVWWP